MTSRVRNLLLAGGVPLVFGLIVWTSGGGPFSAPAPEVRELDPTENIVPLEPAVSPVPSQSPVGTSAAIQLPDSSRREYALGLHELAGLPPDVQSNTPIELWVAWEPPVTDRPRVQRLIRDVIVVAKHPPMTPEGPTAVVVSVPLERIPDLLYGDRYGTLSAVLRTL